jgi:hypothetical protein
MFCLSHLLANSLVDNEQVTLYASVISIVIYSLLYVYLVFFQQDFFKVFNKYIIYVLGVDLLLTALLHFYQKYGTTINTSDNTSNCSEDSILEEEYDLYTQLHEHEHDSDSDHQHPESHSKSHPESHSKSHPESHSESHPESHPESRSESHPMVLSELYLQELPDVVLQTERQSSIEELPDLNVVLQTERQSSIEELPDLNVVLQTPDHGKLPIISESQEHPENFIEEVVEKKQIARKRRTKKELS